jgi:hypothetical protein
LKKLNKKKLINPVKILKKPACSVRFRFYKQKTKKTEPKPKKTGKKTKPNRKNRAKPKKTEPNRFEPVFALKNRAEPKPVGLTRFRFGFVFFLNRFGYFFIKTESDRK